MCMLLYTYSGVHNMCLCTLYRLAERERGGEVESQGQTNSSSHVLMATHVQVYTVGSSLEIYIEFNKHECHVMVT